jgi:putative transposase
LPTRRADKSLMIYISATTDSFTLMPRYRRYCLAGHPVFVTLVTHGRNPWLADEASVQILLASMRSVKAVYRYRHLAHVVLPDHFHWLFKPDDAAHLPKIVAAVKREVTWRFKTVAGLPGSWWQNRFYDHIVRDQDDLARHLDYIHFNPVRHGIARNPGAYSHSSFHEWRRRGAYPEGWGASEPPSIQGMDLD